MNGLLRAREFPGEWKRARLVLIPKGKASPDGTRKFRPICLLDSMGKLYEQFIKTRLTEELDEKGGLSDDQYGFRKGRSTSDAIKEVWKMAKFANGGSWGRKNFCALTTLDVRNAFNTASWREIIEALEEKEISKYLVDVVKSYLSDRKIIVGEGRVVDVTCGVPQGSVLGPALWNVMYDAVLRIELPVGVRTIAFADDLALVTMARKEEELMHITNEALKKIQEWMERAGLELGSQKTESVLLVGQRRPGEVSFCLGGETIVPTTCIKYLGVWVDRGMTFRPHILRTSEKAGKIVTMLGRLMPNVGGASSAKRKILGTVAYSTLLYASNVWAEALQRKNNTNALMRVQRRITLRVVSAYRTVSTEALQVLASSVPIDPMVEGRTNILEGKQAKSENTRRIRKKWQERWSNSTKGGWTRKLIPQIEPWLTRKHGQMDFHLTQALTGHGCFGAYLHRIGKADTPACWYFAEANDDAEHTVFVCPKWEDERKTFPKNASSDPRELIAAMLENDSKWEEAAQSIRNILKGKEKLERQLERR
jgi:hypothetical protein